MRVHISEPPPSALSLRGIRAEAAEGLRWTYRHPTLRPLALSTHGWFLCTAVTSAVLPPFALHTLRLSPFAFGLVLAATGVGGLLGSLTATRLGENLGTGRTVIACRLLTALAWAVTAIAPSGAVLAAAQFLLGLSMGAENANELGYRQAVTPDELQGRMNATLRSTNRAMIVVGAPLGGWAADVFGERVLLWAAACGFLVVAVGLGVSPFRRA